MRNYDEIHLKKIFYFLDRIKTLYGSFAYQSCILALKSGGTKTLFSFEDSKLKTEFEKLQKNFNKSLIGLIETGVASQWDWANKKYDDITTNVIKRPNPFLPHNKKALDSFKKRKVGEFTISQRVWDLSYNHRTEIEFAIDLALKEGQSAQQLSRTVRKHLNNPDKLFRRIRDKHGKLVLSKHAKAFHPGQGVYRSSYKNALRLAGNEINIAYRDSEQLRISQNNDIVGFEIYLSPQHKIYDMCDELKGMYPKDFVWNQWHVGCKCHRRAILKSEKELFEEIENNENRPPESSKNYVNDIPENAKKWLNGNEKRINRMKNKPTWLKSNKKIITP